MKIRARKCTDPPTLKIQSKSSEWFRSHKCNANARKPETFQWNILFHTTFNGSFATLETTKHSPNIRLWSLSLADQKGTELIRKRRGKKTHTSRFHSAALDVLAIIYIGAQSGGIKSSDPCKVTLWAIGYFASQYWLWRCSCWTCIWRKWIRIIFFFFFFPLVLPRKWPCFECTLTLGQCAVSPCKDTSRIWAGTSLFLKPSRLRLAGKIQEWEAHDSSVFSLRPPPIPTISLTSTASQLQPKPSVS